MAKLATRLHIISEKSDEILEPVIRRSATAIATDVKMNAPIDTGELQRSYQIRQGRDFKQMFIGTDVHYSLYMEYGFRHWKSGEFIGPFPHLIPAFHRAEPILRRELAKELKKLEKA